MEFVETDASVPIGVDLVEADLEFLPGHAGILRREELHELIEFHAIVMIAIEVGEVLAETGAIVCVVR